MLLYYITIIVIDKFYGLKIESQSLNKRCGGGKILFSKHSPTHSFTILGHYHVHFMCGLCKQFSTLPQFLQNRRIRTKAACYMTFINGCCVKLNNFIY